MAGIILSSELQRDNVGDTDMKEKDMISDLPDSILHFILSLLPVKDAIRTSILAKRWRYFWTYLSDFDFEVNPWESITIKKENQLHKSANCLFDLVDRLLRKPVCVKRLDIAIYEIYVDADKVNSLISAAVKHKVEDLTLFLYLETCFVLPHSFSASKSLNKLCLELGCDLYIPSGICFPSLKTLELSRVTFANEKSVQQLFSGCLVLQELTLYNCYWKNIEQTSLTIPTLRMLTIHCVGQQAVLLNSKVKIDAANLLSFRCTSFLTVEFVVVNMTSVVDAHIDVVCHFSSERQYTARRAINLLNALGSVKSLRLSNYTLECLYISYAKDTLHLLPSFHNLTHLEVIRRPSIFASKALMDILQKTPKLEVLAFPHGFRPNICLDDEGCILNSVPCCFKSCLKLFCFSNFDGGAVDIQVLKFFLKNARVLREIQLFCSEGLSSDLKKQADIRNQLQHVGLGSCVIKFQFC